MKRPPDEAFHVEAILRILIKQFPFITSYLKSDLVSTERASTLQHKQERFALL
jgi:hypothetical protein